MDQDSLEIVASALLRIGAKELARTVQQRSKQSTPVMYFQFRDRLVEAGRNITDGLWVNISQTRPASPADAQWLSIFEYTVPGFHDFDDARRMEWLLSVPEEDEYVKFIVSNIERLGSSNL